MLSGQRRDLLVLPGRRRDFVLLPGQRRDFFIIDVMLKCSKMKLPGPKARLGAAGPKARLFPCCCGIECFKAVAAGPKARLVGVAGPKARRSTP